MAIFAATFVVLIFLLQRRERLSVQALAAITLPLFPKVTPAIGGIADATVFFFDELGVVRMAGLTGAVRPACVDGLVGKRNSLGATHLICRTLIVFETIFFAMALVVSLPGRFDNLAEIQPMRCLHLLYVLMFLLGGGLLGKFVLQDKAWRWALLFLPLCAEWCWRSGRRFRLLRT